MTTRDQAQAALEGPRLRSPDPKLIQHVADAIARREEGMPAGTRAHSFDYAELLADTPELVDRTEGRLDDPGRATSYALADVLNEAMAYIDEAEDS